MGKEISSKILKVLKNRGLTYEEIGKRMGMSRQGAHFMLHNKEDKNWKKWEIKAWCEEFKIDELKIVGGVSNGASEERR